jgi:hypothetical protein
MDLFHNEIISFCLRKATIKLATGFNIDHPVCFQNNTGIVFTNLVVPEPQGTA